MNIAIILAAGTSKRFKGKLKDKLLAPVFGKPVLYYTLQTLHDHPELQEIYIVVNPNNKTAIQNIVKTFHFPKVKKILQGGATRKQSVYQGFKALKAKKDDIVLIHNAANPLVSAEEITQIISSAKKYNAAAVGQKIFDTIKEIHKGHLIKTHDREKLIAAQTPQAATHETLKNAFKKAGKKEFTDESSLLENAGYKVKHIPASEHNFKITTQHDYERLKIILGDVTKNFLVGLGQDSHQFSTQKGLTLGGIFLKNEQKLEADSDGDVILHALYNAISQALGEGSLGRFATPLLKEKGISDSKKYLQNLLQKLQKRKYHLNNIGLMIEAKTPAIDPLVPSLKKSLSTLTGISERKIGITATSGDNLTSFGKGKGMQCFAIVSLKQHEN